MARANFDFGCNKTMTPKRMSQIRTKIALAGIALCLAASGATARAAAPPLDPLFGKMHDAAALKIGESADAIAFRDRTGQIINATDFKGAPATVLFFLNTECPVSNSYIPRLLRMNHEFRPRGVRFYAVFSNGIETKADVLKYAKDYALTFPTVLDASGDVARRFGIRVTPEVVVLDQDDNLAYRGRIDDNPDSSQVREADLKATVFAALAGKPIPKAETQAFGCFLDPNPAAPARKNAPTYAGDVAAILQKHCQTCHRPGQVGPMSLTTYQEASAFAGTIKDVTQRQVMPPWHAADHFGSFQHSRRLTDGEVATLAKWADGGAPLGDPKKIPPSPTFTDGWELGQPDLVCQAEASYSVAADGADIYRNFVIPMKFDEDRYVTAIEVHPDNRRVVHHIIAYQDFTGKSLALDAKDPGPGYTSSGGGIGFDPDGMIGGWAPGNAPHYLPDGVAIRVPKGSYIVLQVHYHKDGKPEVDRSQIGLHFANAPVQKLARLVPIVNLKMEIPANDPHRLITADWTAPDDLHAFDIMPHMHLLGRRMKLVATLPDGKAVPLIDVPNWDFRWQDTYVYSKPVALPKGTKIHLEAIYDNSTGNPNNPNHPPKLVKWGEQTTDEMCLAYLGVTRDSEKLAIQPMNEAKKLSSSKGAEK
jgi:peroxiredoxin